MEWLTKFPHMDDVSLRNLKKLIDETFRSFTRGYGDLIETFFEPLQVFLIYSERFMTRTPWPIILFLIAVTAWFASRNWKIVASSIVTLLLIGYFDMWDDTMKTISMIFVCTVLSIAIGLPIGIAMSRSERLQNAINPVLDVMQTIAEFCLSNSCRYVVGHRQGTRAHRGYYLRHPADDQADQSWYSTG